MVFDKLGEWPIEFGYPTPVSRPPWHTSLSDEEKPLFDIIYSLEMIGVIAFAISGMIAARRQNMDPVGVFTIGFVTALGGGTLRDTLCNEVPFIFRKDQVYASISFAGCWLYFLCQ